MPKYWGEIPQSGSKAKDGERKGEKKKDGNNNGQLRNANTTSGAACKAAWANTSKRFGIPKPGTL